MAVNTTTILMIVLPLIAFTATLPTLKLGLTLRQLRVVLIPAGATLGASLPMILLSVKTNRARNRAFKPYLAGLKEQVDQLPTISDDSTKKEKRAFKRGVLKLIKPEWATDYRYFLLTELANSYPKKSAPREAIEEARTKSLNS